MNTITQLKKSFSGKMLWGTLAMFACMFTQAQSPIVQVTGGITVVVAGTGGTLGSGGQVGHGGAVVMTDPGNGGFQILTPGGTTPLNWYLWGDISFTPPGPPLSITQTKPATPAMEAIYSFNKNQRPSEGPPNSLITLARSKGRVRITYTTPPCNSYIEFDIYKRYPAGTGLENYIPEIVGPDCLLPNETYTYSVDQIASDNIGDAIGVDDYYWDGIPAGATTVYTSADNSSITFTTGSSVPSSVTLKCCYGKANPWGGTPGTCVTKAIGMEPVEPAYTTAPPVCLNTGTSSFNVTLAPSSVISGAIYTWTAPGTTWVLSQSGTSNQDLTITGVDNNPGTLVLTIKNGICPEAVFTYDIKRNFVTPLTISGSNCVDAGSTYTYSLPANALLNDTDWILPTGWTITGGNGTNSSVNILIPTGTPAGTYTLTAKSDDCSGTVSRTVRVRPATPVFTNTTPDCIVKGTTPVTAIAIDTSVAGTPTTEYVWNLSGAPGWTISSGAGTSTPTFIPNGTTDGPVTISVTLTGTGGCNSSAATLIVSYIEILTYFPPVGCDQYVLDNCTDEIPVWYINGVPATPSSTTIISDNILLLCGSGTPPTSVCAELVIDSIPYMVCADDIGTKGMKLINTSEYEESNAVKIYPNPNKGTFSIELESVVKDAEVKVFDVQGKLVSEHTLKKGENTLNESVPTGMYMLLINVDGKISTHKIQINN